MTAQAMERLYYDEEWHALATTPLEAYLASTGERPPGGGFSTALSRGYIGSWEIKRDRLYLVGLDLVFISPMQGDKSAGRKQGLRKVFPDCDEVLADWFTGTLRCPQGEKVAYVHGGFGSTYEKDLLIEVKAGVVQSVKVKKGKPGTPQRDLGRPAQYVGSGIMAWVFDHMKRGQ